MIGEFADSYWFRSTLFEAEPGEDEETNPRCYGRQPAQWLRGELLEQGYQVEEVFGDDWGWVVMCQRKPVTLWAGCVAMEKRFATNADDPLPTPEEIVWQIFPVAEIPVLKWLFGSRPIAKAAVEKLSADIESALRRRADVEILDERAIGRFEDERDKAAALIEPDDHSDDHLFSLGARVTLAVFAFLFALIMVVHAGGAVYPGFSYFFAVFCAAIGFVVLTKGRARQFFGSFIGTCVFLAGVLYLLDQILGGTLISGSRSEPSVLNALLYLVFFGIPGIVYAARARFGLSKKSGGRSGSSE